MAVVDGIEAQEAAGEAFVERFAQAWAEPTPERLAELAHPGTKNRYPMLEEPVDRNGLIDYLQSIFAAMPDMTVAIHRWAVRGQTVFIEWTARATVAGEPLEFSGVDCVTLDGEKEIDASIYHDTHPIRAALARAAEHA